MTILPQLERDLFEAAEKRLGAAVRSTPGAPVWKRRPLRPSPGGLIDIQRRRLWGALGISSLAALIAGVVVAVGSQSGSHHTTAATAPGRTWQSSGDYVSAGRSSNRFPGVSVQRASGSGSSGTVSSVLVNHYAILRRARTASDSLPAGRQHVTASPDGNLYGLEPSQTRSLTLPGGQRGWFIPGTAGGCLATRGGVGCESSKTLATIGLVDVTGFTTETIYGLVPDGVSLTAVKADGSTVTVPVVDNAFKLSTSSKDPFRTLQEHHSSGAVSDISMPAVGLPKSIRDQLARGLPGSK